jgi:hypothetical protein
LGKEYAGSGYQKKRAQTNDFSATEADDREKHKSSNRL